MDIRKLFLLLFLIILLSLLLGHIKTLESIGLGEDFEDKSRQSNLENGSSGRYINELEYNRSREWIHENKFNLENRDPGDYEVTKYPNSKPTSQQIENAWNLYNGTFESAKDNNWFEFSEAKKDGYKLKDPIHYVNEKFVYDQEHLNTDKPEFLIYHSDPENPGKKILTGAMYFVNNLSHNGSQVGGPLTIWHYHKSQENRQNCLLNNTLVVKKGSFLKDDGDNCPYQISNRTPQMLHVWLIDHPEGQFATRMDLNESTINNSTKLSEKEFKNGIEK